MLRVKQFGNTQRRFIFLAILKGRYFVNLPATHRKEAGGFPLDACIPHTQHINHVNQLISGKMIMPKLEGQNLFIQRVIVKIKRIFKRGLDSISVGGHTIFKGRIPFLKLVLFQIIICWIKDITKRDIINVLVVAGPKLGWQYRV
ncbi:MAG TPA: hypothetical protein ENG03_05575 [Thioploca sp.]|nr:hypothetical protein [Thioploca sp.]